MSTSASDLPTPSTSGATGGASPSPDASTISQMIFLAFGMLAFGLLWVVPLVLLTSALAMFFGSVGIAELLERTRGLAPTTYGGAFWLAVVITGAMVALELHAIVRKAKERRSFLRRLITRPSTAYWALLLPTLLLVRIDIRGTDVPDILTTTLLLCCLGYLWFILPLALTSVAWRFTRWMWRKGVGSSFLAGVLGMLGLASSTCMPLLCVAESDEEPWAPQQEVSNAFDRGLRQAGGQDAVDGSRALMGALAEVLDTAPKALAPSADAEVEGKLLPPSGGSGTQRTNTALFDECIAELFRGGQFSIREKKIAAFARYYVDRAIAEDIIQDAAIETCLLHARPGKAYENLATAFGHKAEDRRKNWYRRQDVRDRCAVSVAEYYYSPGNIPDAESTAIDRAFCSLDEVDRVILELSVMGHDARSIGTRLGLKGDAVRKRKERALEKVRALLQLH